MTQQTPKTFGTTTAAKLLNRSTARIKAICAMHGIGELTHPRNRVLRPSDLKKIEKHLTSRPKQ